MYTTKSFCNIAQFRSNVPGVVSPIGELSQMGESYSREVAVYDHTTQIGYALVNLRSVRDNTKVIMLQELVDQAIGIVKIAVDRTTSTAGEILITELQAEIMQNATRLNISNVTLGPMVKSGNNWVPSSITWTDASNSEQNVHRVWLALEPFLNQYTDYEIVVVPPLTPVDRFFAAPSVVIADVAAITPIQMMERAMAARNNIPATNTRLMEFDYIDITSPDRTAKTYWGVVIYGLAGDNPDAIKDALVAYILANSSYARARWEAIFPDIFKRTEIMMVPLWAQYAATTSQFRHGIYSPFIRSDATVPNKVFAKLPSYAKAHITANAISFFFPYRSLAIASIGNAENRDGKMLITDFFPDYMGIGTEHTDFNRMSTKTQEWIYMLLEAVIMAEAWYDGYDLGKGYYRTVRDGSSWIGFTYDNVQFAVLVKAAVEDGGVL